MSYSLLINKNWTEYFRPSKIDDILSHESILDTLKKCISNKYLPHLLFYGSPGTGKTSTILCIARELLKNEMIRRKALFQKSLQESNVSILPRLKEDIRSSKCPWCKFYDTCMSKDNDETPEAIEMVKEIDLLDITGFIDFKPFI